MSVPVPKRGEGELEVNTKARNMTAHTFKNLENEKYFPKGQEVFINRMRECALDIQGKCWIANNIKVDDVQSRYGKTTECDAEDLRACSAVNAGGS